MANSFPASGLAYADQFSVGSSAAQASSLYVCSPCVQATRIEHTYNQTNLHHNTLWLRAMNSGANLAASIGFTVVNSGGDHHRANIAATGNANQIGGNLALYTRNNSGADNLGIYIDHAGNTGIGTSSPGYRLTISDTASAKLSLCGGTTQNGIIFEKAGSGCGYYIFNGDYANLCGFGIYNSSTAVLPFFINNSSYVGINTASPGYALDVAGGMKGNFYMSCCNATIDGVGPYDYGIIGTGNGAGALLINDIVGARYAVHAGSYNLTFRKSVRGTSTACAYCTVMTFLGTTDTNCDVHVNIANRLGLGTSPSYKLDIAGTSGATASMRVSAAYNGGGLGLVHLTSNGTEGGTITYEKTSGTAQKYKMGLAGDNCFFIYNETAGNQPFTLTPSGNFGLSTNTPSYKLHVNGTFYAAGSSIKYKEGICNYDTDSCLFMCLKPVTYQYKDEWQHLGRELKSQSQIGLIAEDVAQVMPELAILVNEEDEKVVRNVDYEKLSVVLLKEVQKLRQEVDELKNNK